MIATNKPIKTGIAALSASIFLFTPSTFAKGREYEVVNHGIYKAIIDCNTRLPVVITYRTSVDTGNAQRYPEYIPDPVLLKNNPNCHPFINGVFKTYQAVLRKWNIHDEYDVGHLAMSNHLDDNESSVMMANYFTNLAPQAAKKNRSGGAWYATEKIIECHRERESILNLAGVIDDPATKDKDYFVKHFGQTTPDYWWRVAYFEKSNQYAAWLIPNQQNASEKNLDSGLYDITLRELAKRINISIPEINTLKSWDLKRADKAFIKTSTAGKRLICEGVEAGVG